MKTSPQRRRRWRRRRTCASTPSAASLAAPKACAGLALLPHTAGNRCGEINSQWNARNLPERQRYQPGQGLRTSDHQGESSKPRHPAPSRCHPVPSRRHPRVTTLRHPRHPGRRHPFLFRCHLLHPGRHHLGPFRCHPRHPKPPPARSAGQLPALNTQCQEPVERKEPCRARPPSPPRSAVGCVGS